MLTSRQKSAADGAKHSGPELPKMVDACTCLRMLAHLVIHDSGKVSLEHLLLPWYPSQRIRDLLHHRVIITRPRPPSEISHVKEEKRCTGCTHTKIVFMLSLILPVSRFRQFSVKRQHKTCRLTFALGCGV